jgi:hypothetical protein
MKLCELHEPKKGKKTVIQPEERQDTGERDAHHWYQQYYTKAPRYTQSKRTGPYPEGYKDHILKPYKLHECRLRCLWEEIDWAKQAIRWLQLTHRRTPKPEQTLGDAAKLFKPEMMDLYPKDAMQAIFKLYGGQVTPIIHKLAQRVAEYVHDYSLAPRNVYKRAIEFADSRKLNYDQVLAFANAAAEVARRLQARASA